MLKILRWCRSCLRIKILVLLSLWHCLPPAKVVSVPDQCSSKKSVPGRGFDNILGIGIDHKLMETQMGRNQKRMKKPDWVAMAAGVPHQEAPSHLARSCGPPQSSLNFSQLSLKWFVTQTLWCPLKRIPPKSSKACFALGKNLRTKITFLQRILIPVALFSCLFFPGCAPSLPF